ncbi:MAG: UvrD-helicase domain-containing protein [Chloroflexi bacterium]|nr:UvrD-helicase domain-containing protein [Chloroflexota bacterium]
MQIDILEGLNPAQREAAEHLEGPLLIVAGPGSGKTRVITHRIAYLMKRVGVKPFHIVAVTFTNKAAREIRERLFGKSAKDSASPLLSWEWRDLGITVSTFHAFCASHLRRDGHLIGLDRSFVIYDQEDQQSLIKRAMDEAKIDPKRYPTGAIHSAISQAKSVLLDPAQYAATVKSYYEEIVLRIYERYQGLLTQSNALDFDDLILRTVRLLEQSPEALEKYRSRYIHLMVDEFQDTNVAQYALAKLITGKYRNICVVGDPDQSIYSWRNADIRNILSFQKDYPDAKVVNLGENYRSTRNILEAAKGLITPNKARIQRDLWTSKEAGAPIIVKEAHTEEEEAQMVVEEAERLVKREKLHYADCAVLYRINAQSRALEEACLRFGIPYRLIGGLRFYQRKEVKDIIAYLRVIQNPYDEVSLARIINTPTRAIGQRTLEDATAWARARSLPLYAGLQALVDAQGDGVLNPRAVAALDRFLQLMGGLQGEASKLGAADLLDAVVERTGYRHYLMESSSDRGEEQWENVRELRGQAAEIQEMVGEGGLEAFLEKVALVSDVDILDETKDALTLITLHQAKGLEFPAVFIVGMEEGLLPHARSRDDPAELEEERRLCYVGVTRAQQRLYLFRAFRRQLMGGNMPSIPSRFLQDIPRELIATSTTATSPSLPGMISRPGRSTISAGGPRDGASPGPVPLKAGDRVTHKQFGEGIVVSCVAAGADHEVTVAFRSGAGVKRLLLSFAPLQKAE